MTIRKDAQEALAVLREVYNETYCWEHASDCGFSDEVPPADAQACVCGLAYVQARMLTTLTRLGG